MPHLQVAHKTNMSVVHLDFVFLGRDEDPQRTMAVVVEKERSSKMSVSTDVPRKTTGAYIAKRVAGFFARSRMSAQRHVVKSDQGARSALGRLKVADGSGRYVVEYSPTGASQSNGMAIHSVSGQTRLLLSAFKEKWGCSIPYDHSVIFHIVHFNPENASVFFPISTLQSCKSPASSFSMQ